MDKLFLLVLIVVIFSVSAKSEQKSNDFNHCLWNVKCIEGKMVAYLNQIEEGLRLPILGEKNEESDFSLPKANPKDLIERGIQFLRSDYVKIRIPKDVQPKKFEENRSKKLKKMLMPFLLFIVLKSSIVVPLILTIVALVSFKGMGLSLAALALAGVTALKSLLMDNHGNSKVTYEVLTAPHWSRSGGVNLEASPFFGADGNGYVINGREVF